MEEYQIDICKKAIDKYGDKQIIVAMEECAELIQALSKYLRDGLGKSILNIHEEIADVEIMIQQLKISFCCYYQVENWIEIKTKRLEERMKD